ncbi:short-subunit dehydrogenase [Bradyrhizobium sp. LM3.2]
MKQWILGSKVAAPSSAHPAKGLGRACAISLAEAGVHVTLTARGAEALKKTADDIRKACPDVTVTEIVGDITTPAGREAVLKACPEPDILINNAGGPPPGDFRNWTRDDWIKAIDANMLTPIELIKSTVDGMMARKFGRIVNITSAAVKAPIDILGLSNGARAGLTGFIAGLSRKTVINNVTINGLLPVARSRPTACAAPRRGNPRSAASRRTRFWPNAPSSIPRAASAIPTSSATPAPSCAAAGPASSPARTFCSTAVPSRERCEGSLVRRDRTGGGRPHLW